MYKNLDHLSSEEIEKLKERYYSKDKEKLSNIIKDYELDVRTGELVKLIPDLQLEEKCEHCGTPLKFRYKSRTYYYSADHKKGEPYCPKCGHLPEEKHCKCHICEEMRRQAAELERQRKLQEIQRKKQAIYDAYIGIEPTKDFNDLTLREKILLGTLCHALIDENLAVLRPLEHFDGRIFYSEYAAGYGYEDDAIDIVRELFQSNILAVSFDSPIEAFTEENFPNRFYLNKVRFKINLKFSDGIAVCIKKLMYPEFDGSSLNGEVLSDDDIWYIADMWKKLVLYDSYDFLLYEIDRVGFNFNIGEKTELSFKYMLEHFSVAQIYNIVFRAVALASKSYLENGITKKHAANLIIGNCTRYAESAVANGWDIADFVRDTFKRSEYNRIVLPFALFRRLECALEDTRDAVMQALAKHEAEWGRENDGYCDASKRSFYNLSTFRLNTLGGTNTYNAFMDYINAFSPNAREILLKFEIENTAKRLSDAGILYEVCKKFGNFDLSPENVSDREMSDIYEHLIERYGDEIAEGAEDFMTPKDVVRLAVGMLFANDDEILNSDKGIVRTIYDPTMGTGGFITDALDLLNEWHKDKKMKAPAVIVPYGEECEAESWAMGKANLLLRNVATVSADKHEKRNDLSEHIMYGNTLTDDKFEDKTFNYILSNPPYGKKWEKEKKGVEEEAKLGFKGRFGAGLPSVDDGSMLFLQHVVSKMAPVGEGGGKVGIVLSASPLFNGDPGSGPSTIRRWLFQKDYIDCIVKLPSEIFFRTSIHTYLWILTNNKSEDRKGKIQLIDASNMRTLLRKNRGKKRYEINDEQRDWIIKTYIDGHDHGNSVLVPVEDFMYRRVITQRPLRMHLVIPEDFAEKGYTLGVLKEVEMALVYKEIEEYVGDNSYKVVFELAKIIKNAIKDVVALAPKQYRSLYTPKNIEKWLLNSFGVVNPEYEAVDKKGNIIPENEILAYADTNAEDIITDSDLKDYEDIDWNTAFDEYMNKEVLPFIPDAWIDKTATDEKGSISDHEVGTVGTKISFNKYFYKYEVPKEPETIAKELMEMEAGLDGFMKEFLNV